LSLAIYYMVKLLQDQALTIAGWSPKRLVFPAYRQVVL
jgi:hypothetical protein